MEHQPFAFVGQGSHDARWERRCLAGAAATVFATESMKQHYLATFPLLRSRVTATIPNGWDDTGVFGPGTATVPPDPSRPAVIGFFGFLGEHWDFEEFVRTLAAALVVEPVLADRIRIAVYGNVSPENVRAIGPRADLDDHQASVPRGGARHGLLQTLALQRMARVSEDRAQPPPSCCMGRGERWRRSSAGGRAPMWSPEATPRP
jgi:hypothetical protein